MRPVSDFTPIWSETSISLARQQSPFIAASTKTNNAPHGEDTDESLNTSIDAEYIRPPVVRDADRLEPFYVAGHDRQRPVPGAPFPHADTETRIGGGTGYTRIREYIHKVDRDDYVDASIQQRHLMVVTSILHTSLLKNDWTRAARAWALILRTIHAGTYIDIRAHGRWAIGAEILLQQGISVSPHIARTSYGHDAFQGAKDYLERLILQYPYHKNTPKDAVCALDFYPALFGLHVLEVVSSTAMAVAQMDDPDSDRSTDEVQDIVTIKTAELESAISIGTKLDAVLVGPPYDRNASLLTLRGMIALWTADLYEEIADKTGYNLRSKRSSLSAADSLREAGIERARARRLLRTAVDVGAKLTEKLQAFFDDNR